MPLEPGNVVLWLYPKKYFLMCSQQHSGLLTFIMRPQLGCSVLYAIAAQSLYKLIYTQIMATVDDQNVTVKLFSNLRCVT